MLPYTILLGLVLVYWAIVIMGFIDIEILDFGDFDLDGALEELGEVGETAANSTEAGVSSAFQSMLGFLSVGQVPVTIIVSLFVFQMWVIAFFLQPFFPSFLVGTIPLLIAHIILFVIFGVVSLFLVGLTTRPFRPLFKHTTTHGHQTLIGKVCVIKSSKVTPTFGQAEMTIHDSNLLLSVVGSEELSLKKGDEAVIVGYDKIKNIYTVREI